MLRLSRTLPAIRALKRCRLSNTRVGMPVTASRFGKVSRPYASSTMGSDSFLQGDVANYVDEMYESWLKDPSSVHVSWDAYFRNLKKGAAPTAAFTAPPTLIPGPIGSLSMVPSTQTASNEDILTHLRWYKHSVELGGLHIFSNLAVFGEKCHL